MPGPLPTGKAVRRNAPTIPTTRLPVSGRKGRAPNPPDWVTLGEAGAAFWAWAWKQPQALAWDTGTRPALARRAMLEDLFMAAAAVGDRVEGLLSRMESLDVQLGLTPKAMAQLRWQIVADEEQAPDVSDEVAAKKAERQRRAQEIRAAASADAAR